jgi:hypothetical protein
LYPRPPEVVVAFAAHPVLARSKSVSTSPHMQDDTNVEEYGR